MKATGMVFLALVMTTALVPLAHAQPALEINRIALDWPTVEVYITASCNGQESTALTVDNFEIGENGLPMKVTGVECQPQICEGSLALVIDGSGTMEGEGIEAAVAASQGMVDRMEAGTDEGALLRCGRTPWVVQEMTKDLAALRDAIQEDMQTFGASFVWDGMYLGAEYLVQTASNPCKAVIIFTDGDDNASDHTPAEVIAYASSNRVRIFIVAVGDVVTGPMPMIASLTGGAYYENPTASDLDAMYEEIRLRTMNNWGRCIVSYDSECMDGGARTVDLTLKDFCGGSVLQTRKYLAPLDSSTFAPMDFDLGEGSSVDGGEIVMPVYMDAAIQDSVYFYPSTFTIKFNQTCLRYNRFEAPPGTILEGVPVEAREVYEGVEITTGDRLFISGGGLLGYCHFTPATNPRDSMDCQVSLDSWRLVAGCFLPVLHDGKATIYHSERPFIIVGGLPAICEGDSIKLTAPAGFGEYQWSTGDSTRTIWVSQSGVYSLTAKNLAGQASTSDPITITLRSVPVPAITPSGVVEMCKGNPVTITAEAGYKEYLWSTGETTMSITVHDTGRYSYTALNASGCRAESPPLQVQRKGPDPEILGDEFICGDSAAAVYFVSDEARFEYTWSVDGGEILGPADSSVVLIMFVEPTATIMVDVYDPLADCTVRTEKQVTIRARPKGITAQGGTVFCEGDKVHLSVEDIYDSYEWNIGGGQNFIEVSNTGDYFCKITSGPCTFYTDTIRVSSMEDLDMYIMGDTNVCQYAEVTYSAPQYEGLTYNWRLVGESTFSQYGNPVTLRWKGGTTGKVVLTYGPFSCRNTIEQDVTLRETQQPTIAATPDTIGCMGDSVQLTAESGFTEYIWSNGQTGPAIWVDSTGQYTVSAVDAGGCRRESEPVAVTFVALPPKPVIIHRGDTLVCTTPGYTYEWYRNGVLIPGERGRTYIPQTAGNYSVRAYDGPCYSESDPPVIVGIGSYAPGLAARFDIAPNPSNGQFRISLTFDRPAAFSLRLVNTVGTEVYSETVQQPAVSYTKNLHLDGTPPGMYFLILGSGDAYDFRKVMIHSR